jgi:large subunit ribosomal protein L7/L12
VSDGSWAADNLKAKGEKLSAREGDDIVVSMEMMDQPSEHVKKLSEEFLKLNAVEASQLLKLVQMRVGISDAMLEGFFGGGGAPRAAAAPAAGGDAGGAAEPAAPAKPKENWDLKLVSFDAAAKIKIIKEIRTITALGLKEAKEMAEKPLPVILKSGVKTDDAKKFVEAVKAVGGVLELV